MKLCQNILKRLDKGLRNDDQIEERGGGGGWGWKGEGMCIG